MHRKLKICHYHHHNQSNSQLHVMALILSRSDQTVQYTLSVMKLNNLIINQIVLSLSHM